MANDRFEQGLVTYCGRPYRAASGATKLKTVMALDVLGEKKVYFYGKHMGHIRQGQRLRFQVGQEKYGDLRVYGRCRVTILKDTAVPEPVDIVYDLGYVSYSRDDRYGEGYCCITKRGPDWLTIPCVVIEAWQSGRPLAEVRDWIDTPFPGNGMGILEGKVLDGRVISIKDFRPHQKERTWSVPMSEVEFLAGGIRVGAPNGSDVVIVSADKLPFATTPYLNAFRDEFTGVLHLAANLMATGKWNRAEKRAEVIWCAGDVAVGVEGDDLGQFQQVVYSHERAAAFSAVAQKVRELTAQGVTLLLAQVLSEFKEQGITDVSEAEAEELLYSPEYDERFLKALRQHQDQSVPILYTMSGVLFTVDGSLVYERPVVGAATYIFQGLPTMEAHRLREVDGFEDLEIEGRDWPALVAEGFWRANKLDIRYGEVGQLLGCLGFSIHGDPENNSRWLGQVLSAARSQAAAWCPPELQLGSG